MSEWIRSALIDRLHGAHIHVDPMVAVDGLSEEDAVRHPFEGGRSPMELVYHMIYWMEFSMDLIGGEPPEYIEGSDWENGEENWGSLVERFRKDLSNMEFMAENWELKDTVKISDELATFVGAEIIGAIQHTSYHLGQLVAARRAIGAWPRP
ncbi:DinB family protein [Candidatus Bathyarchaeota archaeon]|nr:DinB family protein [Candidatus Bathyarchaeota archaeon]